MCSTREIREKPRLYCDGRGWQRCHNVGLNLIKQILNHYTRVYHLVLSRAEFETLRRDLNDPDLNLRCCTTEANRRDIDIEREVLRFIFEGEPSSRAGLSAKALEMFEELVILLKHVKSDVATGHQSTEKIERVLRDIAAEQFPLARYCAECGTQCFLKGEESGLPFCDTRCQERHAELGGSSLPFLHVFLWEEAC